MRIFAECSRTPVADRAQDWGQMLVARPRRGLVFQLAGGKRADMWSASRRPLSPLLSLPSEPFITTTLGLDRDNRLHRITHALHACCDGSPSTVIVRRWAAVILVACLAACAGTRTPFLRHSGLQLSSKRRTHDSPCCELECNHTGERL